jgi:uncharacterized protein (DUF58 family)
MASGRLLQAPADMPAGRRGWRAWLACGVALAAVPVLALSYPAGFRERAAFFLVAAALVTAAILLWTARRTLPLTVAAVMIAASAMAVVSTGVPNRVTASGGTRGAEMDYSYDPDGRAITRAQAEAVPKGSSEDEVRAILGSPAGDGTLRTRDGTDSHCLVYMDQSRRDRFDDKFALCFAGDSYRSLHRWL